MAAVPKAQCFSHSNYPECGIFAGFCSGQHHAFQLRVYCHAESGASDREKLGRLLNISNEQMNYITNVEAGSGLIKYGSALVPFINRFPKNTKLYQLMTTRPGEGRFAGQS